MTNGIQGVFGTPLYFALIDNAKEVKNEFYEIQNSLQFFDAPDAWGKPHKLTTQNFEDDVISRSNMKIIKKVIDDNLHLYLSALQLPVHQYLMTSWITSFQKGEYAPVHNHLNADISGVYYYETNEKMEIFFLLPQH